MAACLLPAAARAADVCPGVAFEGAAIDLTAVERRLVCGDPDSEAWREVPKAQARRFLKAFLQQRGYHYPRIDDAGPGLRVDPGEKTVIKALEGDNLPPGVDLSKRRRVVGEAMTPAMLDKLKADIGEELRNRGYPCPEVALSADAKTGAVVARFAGGETHVADPIEEPAIPGIDPGIFRRFEAFRRDRPIDQRLLTLTSNRVVSEALFLNSSYDVTCGTEGVRIVHRVASAPPRLLRIGVGVDSEGLVLFRARWKHSRIGWRASSSEATAFASKREQSLDALMRHYLRPSSRLHLIPHAAAARTDEPRYEAVSGRVSLMPAYAWDDQTMHLEVRAGPALEYADTRRGVGPQNSYFQTFNTYVEVTSHRYEYFVRDPRAGFHATLETASRVSEISSSLTAHRVRLWTEKLWNVGGHEPPLAVLGARGWVGGTVVGDVDAARQELPVSMRFFIGGNSDFRGVGPGELGDENGFLTGVYQGLELRAGDLLPLKLQPLVFIDAAMAGRSSLRLDPDVYYAPGFGARWPTPIGAFRVTFARSLLWRRDPATAPGRSHWQFFFSYGREF
ncbi:MAG: BamA/TamA family outer membrane protein [Elusimicrobia bacterium]|nr:BamA/TamA family outer membrane protein [Elusimicrobiota bacterium]